jgi:hypothetical protein
MVRLKNLRKTLWLVDLGLEVISVKQLSASGQSPVGIPMTRNISQFLVTFTAKIRKSQDIVKLTSLCHITKRVEAYKAQSGQCYNRQQFGNVWANCKQLPRCLWCGNGLMNKECPENDKKISTPACCNCKFVDGEKYPPSGAKNEICKRSRRAHSRLQRKGCYLPVTPPQVCPS